MLDKGILSSTEFLTSFTGIGEHARIVFGLNMTSDVSDGLVPEHTTQTTDLLYAISHY